MSTLNTFFILYEDKGRDYALTATDRRLQLVDIDTFLSGELADGTWMIDMDDNHGRGPGGVHTLYHPKYDAYVDDANGEAVLVSAASVNRPPLLAFTFLRFAGEHGGDAWWRIGVLEGNADMVRDNGRVAFLGNAEARSVWQLKYL